MQYNILVADDNLVIIETIIFYFEEYNEPYKIIRAENGEIAYKLAELHLPSTELSSILTEIKEVSRNEAWQQYENYFNTMHPDFATKLINKHPDLSPAEIKLCYFCD